MVMMMMVMIVMVMMVTMMVMMVMVKVVVVMVMVLMVVVVMVMVVTMMVTVTTDHSNDRPEHGAGVAEAGSTLGSYRGLSLVPSPVDGPLYHFGFLGVEVEPKNDSTHPWLAKHVHDDV